MTSGRRISRVAVLWRHVTGYLKAALREMLADPDVRLFVVQNRRQSNATFAPLAHDRCRFIDLVSMDNDSWLEDLRAFNPDLAIITGIRDKAYLKAAHLIRDQGGFTVWADDRVLRVPFRDLYQMLSGRLLGIWRDYEAAFVPGYAAAAYARSIGFPETRIFQGLYTCDTELFRPVGIQRHHHNQGDADWPQVFLFLGQFIERKGIDTLLEAYRRYRARTTNPWELWCAGAGPLRSVLEGQVGVKLLGFLKPEACTDAMAHSGALVIPSRWDHWPLVVHESTCAGLPVIASRKCFSIIELVQDGYNGFTFPPGNVSYLTQVLLECANPRLAMDMGENSLRLSYRFDPRLFAWQVLENIPLTLDALRNDHD